MNKLNRKRMCFWILFEHIELNLIAFNSKLLLYYKHSFINKKKEIKKANIYYRVEEYLGFFGCLVCELGLIKLNINMMFSSLAYRLS